EKVESSQDRDEQLWVLLGHGQLIPGLETALESREAGEALEVDVAAVDGYGERQEGQIQRMSKKYFPQSNRLKPGMVTLLHLKEGGQRAVTVHKVGMSAIDVDLNPPMAGKDLHFDVSSATCARLPRKNSSTDMRIRRAVRSTDRRIKSQSKTAPRGAVLRLLPLPPGEG